MTRDRGGGMLVGPLVESRAEGSPLIVSEAMVTRPRLHPSSLTIGELRQLFGDDHLHTVLLSEEGRLISVLERTDLETALGDELPATLAGGVDGRTVRPEAPLEETATLMRASGRRRLAVVTPDARILGLLCLKASGTGFCSDADVERRSEANSARSNEPR